MARGYTRTMEREYQNSVPNFLFITCFKKKLPLISFYLGKKYNFGGISYINIIVWDFNREDDIFRF